MNQTTTRAKQREIEIAALAGQALHMVNEFPKLAFAAGITRLMQPSPANRSNLENDVGASLRFLEKSGFVTSTKTRHPQGEHATVRLYELTPLGAFMLSLAGNFTEKKAVA